MELKKAFSSWKCHVCGEERPDEKISVLTKPLVINDQVCGEQNIRYCNDRPACIEGAKEFSFSKGGKEGRGDGIRESQSYCQQGSQGA